MSLVDIYLNYVPTWLAGTKGGKILGTLIAFLDTALSNFDEASNAAVGRGTVDALTYVGDERGVIRGRLDDDASYRVKLRGWIQARQEDGSQLGLAKRIWEYLGDSRVRVVNRAGHWITIETDGSVSVTDASWDWDSVSNPERNDPLNPYWSDEWIIIYPTYPVRPGTMGELPAPTDGYGLGQMVPRNQVNDILDIISQSKAAHSKVRAILWCSDSTKYDPANNASKPDGTWGQWSINSGGHQIASGRDLTVTRYWEPL